jgi:hypothetical protein
MFSNHQQGFALQADRGDADDARTRPAPPALQNNERAGADQR